MKKVCKCFFLVNFGHYWSMG